MGQENQNSHTMSSCGRDLIGVVDALLLMFVGQFVAGKGAISCAARCMGMTLVAVG